ncbi:MAG TPA: IS4 family transposase [Burkholderiaceae bacterium]|nr:IS4 family transposase [Burkholderiaceae bacterium]
MQTVPWATYTCRYAQFGDKRLKQRLVSILEDLAAHPQASLPEALGTPHLLAAYYDFIANPRVTEELLLHVAQTDSVGRLPPGMVLLALHDTSEYNWTTHAKTQGLGPLSNPRAQGLHVHSTLALTIAGVPWGLLAQECWARNPATTGKRHTRHTRAYDDKESARWSRGLATVHQLIPETVHVINIADREADIYNVFTDPRPANSDLLIRVRHNRVVTAAAPGLRTLRAAVEAAPEVGGMSVDVRARPDQPARRAHIRLRVTPVEVHRPQQHPNPTDPERVGLTVIQAVEVDPPPNAKRVEWLLLTTLTVADLETACQLVSWYSLRWLIERYHFVLKSGLHVEDCQVRTAPQLQKALTLYALVAVRLLSITYAARQSPAAPCTCVLTACEWQTLHIATQAVAVPETPPTLDAAVRQLARLGGHRAWPSAGPPGVHVLWRGWRKLQAMVQYAERLTAV